MVAATATETVKLRIRIRDLEQKLKEAEETSLQLGAKRCDSCGLVSIPEHFSNGSTFCDDCDTSNK